MLKNKSTSSYKLLDSANGLLKVRPSPKNCVARSGLEEERSDGRRPDLTAQFFPQGQTFFRPFALALRR